MSDLPDTPFCRVLPSGHEVHYWDKSGTECLCRVAVKAEKPRAEVDLSKYMVVTTLAMRKRHLARWMHQDRSRGRLPGLVGGTLCGHSGAANQERVDYERAQHDRKPLVVADLPECRACLRSAEAEARELAGDLS